MNNKNKKYWKSNLKIVFSLLVIWFVSSFGFGILFSDYLDQFQLGGFKLGFWFAQQGAIWVFLAVLAYYGWASHRLDQKFDVDDD